MRALHGVVHLMLSILRQVLDAESKRLSEEMHSRFVLSLNKLRFILKFVFPNFPCGILVEMLGIIKEDKLRKTKLKIAEKSLKQWVL
ncbi:hypothetical protein LAZ67_7001715 [Cordylochernes scorpioides]|uniref:Uncharacterized protein n=1 Tax=Cordylochernes scorpioides TaxID=51811 RepID=A0ABY6KMI1_9ARAC|nr:hypothetical protein LAZ67_7001715 [Cordylochernes scorpioides]